MQPLHDLIGSTYAASRRADPAIVQELCRKISLEPSGAYLDLGCGTGNYTVALSSLGGAWSAIDSSKVMLAQAAQKSPSIEWIQSSAERLPFADGTFDGAICTLAIHHLPELESPFAEVRRTLRSGRFVIFTGLAEQMRHYWLCHYFPEMMARAIQKILSETAIREALVRSGFTSAYTTPFHVTNELQDLFLFSGEHRPRQYLDPAVRASISSFANLARDHLLQRGNHLLSGRASVRLPTWPLPPNCTMGLSNWPQLCKAALLLQCRRGMPRKLVTMLLSLRVLKADLCSRPTALSKEKEKGKGKKKVDFFPKQ